MSDDSIPTMQPSRKPTLGDRIRDIAQQLRQESDIQIKTTSRILGAAAQIAQNHDQLIDEVVEMVEDDLEPTAQMKSLASYTVEQLKQQFKTLSAAKVHFGIKANSWTALVSKLNQQPISSTPKPSQDLVLQRLEAIEQDVQTIRSDVSQILTLLNRLLPSE